MAVRAKVSFVCSECGASYPKWQGQCTVCKEWNTLKEEVERPSLSKGGGVVERITGHKPAVARPLHSIEASEELAGICWMASSIAYWAGGWFEALLLY